MRIMLILSLLVFPPSPALAQSPARLIDPLRPSHYQPQPQVEVQSGFDEIEKMREQLQLTAILTSADRAMAVINGRPLQVEQTIGDFRLTEIGADYVILSKGDQKLTLYRTISGVKKSSAPKQ